jgi:hypothetical protein
MLAQESIELALNVSSSELMTRQTVIRRLIRFSGQSRLMNKRLCFGDKWSTPTHCNTL